jgi:hypothetical protein
VQLFIIESHRVRLGAQFKALDLGGHRQFTAELDPAQANELTNKKTPAETRAFLPPKRSITSAGRLVGRPVRASDSAADSAAGSADQASAGRHLVGHHPGRLDLDYSQSSLSPIFCEVLLECHYSTNSIQLSHNAAKARDLEK